MLSKIQRRLNKRFCAVFLIFTMYISPLSAPKNAEAVVIADAVLTSVVFQGVLSELNAMIEQAFSEANFVVWNAGIQARLAIERWGEVNDDLMDKAFGELNDAQKDIFRNLNDFVANLDIEIHAVGDKAQGLLDQVQQIISDVKWGDSPRLIRYKPSVVLLERSTPKLITITGLNLDEGNPLLWLVVDGKSLQMERLSLTNQSASFGIPENLLTSKEFAPTLIRGQIRMEHKKKRWLGLLGTDTKLVTTDINLALLPSNMGQLVEVETYKTNEKREYSDWKNREFYYSSGSLSEKCDVQTQNPSLDHKIDPDTVEVWHNRPNPRAGETIPLPFGGGVFRQPDTLRGEWGRGGSQKLQTKTTEGFAIRLCAKRWTDGWPPDTGPGYKHVVYRWKEFKEVRKVEKKSYPLARNVSWLDDEVVKVEQGIDGILAKIRLFSNETNYEIRERLSEPYYTLEIENKNGIILLKPKIPANLDAIIN